MEEWWYRLTRRQRWLVVAAVAAYFTLSFVNSGIWAFVTVILVLAVCCPLSYAFGQEAARRYLNRRLELTDNQYENAVSTAMRAVQDNAQLTGELIATRKDLAAAHLRQATLRARLNEAGIAPPIDDTEESRLVTEAQLHP
ncbi:hypothetical protein [Nonomuraea sp. LPB2021202275-12-8]|uniref:hypothetical protein n=1 Tax=Nonomuraea sp. LPB2021202275-12-8 TaxID=3120159 RepID=UPI00300CDB88